MRTRHRRLRASRGSEGVEASAAVSSAKSPLQGGRVVIIGGGTQPPPMPSVSPTSLRSLSSIGGQPSELRRPWWRPWMRKYEANPQCHGGGDHRGKGVKGLRLRIDDRPLEVNAIFISIVQESNSELARSGVR